MGESRKFVVLFTPEAAETIGELKSKAQHRAKAKKVEKALTSLAVQGPDYPALRTHKYTTMRGPDKRPIYQSYVENRTPSAWRIWWWYGPDSNEITVLAIGKHP